MLFRTRIGIHPYHKWHYIAILERRHLLNILNVEDTSQNALPNEVELEMHDVLCEQQESGWRGCWDCHFRLAEAAQKEHHSNIYVVLEAKARPTLRFSYERLLNAASALEANPQWEVVNLSILPWPFKGHPRRQVTSEIYENAEPTMNGTTALLCTPAFAKRILSTEHNEPIDLQLANAGVARYAVYPAFFQRNAEASSTTAPLVGRRWLSSPYGYMLTEIVSHFPHETFLVCVFLISFCVVAGFRLA